MISPFNITLGLTYKCNSRCQTCNIWKKEKGKELSLEEYEKIFKGIGCSPAEVILTGGEPFLREEIVQICRLISQYLRPKAIIIPTNGILAGLIVEKVKEIVSCLPKTKIILNLSLDGTESLHDQIRGVPGNFEKAVEAFRGLNAIRNKNFDLKIHTVISKFNVEKIPQIYQGIKEYFGLVPIITEIAEERMELGTVGSGIAPLVEDYTKSVNFLIAEIKKEKFKELDRITQAFRLEYYELVKRILLNKKQAIPCYAGIASAQITPDGEVWACCVKAESMGNLRQENYNFKKIWRSDKAKNIRKSIKERKCYCPLANASYTNMFFYPPALFKVVLRLL